MLKRIVHPSAFLVTFVTLLPLNLSKPQRKHLLRTADAIIVCEGRKTLANLYRQWVEAPDASAVADFFRVSPWEAEEIYRMLGPFVIADMLRRAEEEGAEPIIWASIDDSATRKDKDTHALEAVDWIFDHSASGKGQTAHCKGAVHVTLRVQIGSYSYTFAWRLYLREKTVRRLNRRRPTGKRLRFKSKYRLAREMLEELHALLPEGYMVYVLFDRWYASGKLIKFMESSGRKPRRSRRGGRPVPCTREQQLADDSGKRRLGGVNVLCYNDCCESKAGSSHGLSIGLPLRLDSTISPQGADGGRSAAVEGIDPRD